MKPNINYEFFEIKLTMREVLSKYNELDNLMRLFLLSKYFFLCIMIFVSCFQLLYFVSGVIRMRKLELLFSNEVTLEDQRKMKLDYSLTESCAGESAESYYGIQIRKYLDDVTESDEVNGISYSRDTVISMIRKLFQYEVTPISMAEIIDELVTVGV